MVSAPDRSEIGTTVADRVEDKHNDQTIRRSRASMPPRNPRTRAPSLRRLHSIALTPAGYVHRGRRVVPVSGWQRAVRLTALSSRRATPCAALCEFASTGRRRAGGVVLRLATERSTLIRAGRSSDQGESGDPSPVPRERRPAHAGLCGCRRAAPQPAAARGHPARTRHDLLVTSLPSSADVRCGSHEAKNKEVAPVSDRLTAIGHPSIRSRGFC